MLKKPDTGKPCNVRIDPITASVMLFNFTSAVGIIFVNKVVFKEYQFQYATFLTVCHFLITFIGLYVLTKIKYFEPKKVPISEVIPLCLAFCGFVVFNNLSLQENTVGFYQLMKVMTTPVVASIQYFVYGVAIARRLMFALIPVILGVIIVTCNEVELRPWGLIYAVCGVLSTSFYQVWVKTRQQDLHLSPPQLLYYQAPISAVMVLFLTPLFDPIFSSTTSVSGVSQDTVVGLLDYRPSEHGSYALFWVLLSCVLAFCVNLSIFLTIGRTSPISYNVLGHFKLCVITVGGMLFFSEDMNDRKLVGIAVALLGITLYTYWKLQITSNWDKRGKTLQTQQTHESNIITNKKELTPLKSDREAQVLHRPSGPQVGITMNGTDRNDQDEQESALKNV